MPTTIRSSALSPPCWRICSIASVPVHRPSRTSWCSSAGALDALHALNARFGLVAEHVDESATEDALEPGAMRLVSTALHLQAHVGRVADDVTRALEDQRIDDQKAEELIATGRKGQRLFQRLIHAARNLAKRRRR